jgi:hypothetical protein
MYLFMVFTWCCMTWFDLPANYHSDLESLIRKSRSRLSSPGYSGSHVWEIVSKFQESPPPHERALMAAWRCINEFSSSSSANIRTGPEMNIRDGSFELKLALINMVQQSPFCGKASEDANAHLQHFLEICSTFTIWGVTQGVVRLHLSPFSLLGKEKQWCYSNKEAVTWENQCPPEQDLWVSATNRWDHHQGMGMSVWLYLYMPPSRHGGVVHHPKLLSWVDSLSLGAYRWCC